MSELLLPQTFDTNLLGSYNYTLNNPWENTNTLRFFTNVSKLPTFSIPPNSNHILITTSFTFSTDDAVTLSNLRFFTIFENLLVAPQINTDPVWAAFNQVDLAAGAFLTGPAVFNLSASIMIGPNASTVLPAVSCANTPQAAFTSGGYTGQRSVELINSAVNAFTNDGPIFPRVRFFFQADGSGGNFTNSTNAAATTTGYVYAINYIG